MMGVEWRSYIEKQQFSVLDFFSNSNIMVSYLVILDRLIIGDGKVRYQYWVDFFFNQ